MSSNSDSTLPPSDNLSVSCEDESEVNFHPKKPFDFTNIKFYNYCIHCNITPGDYIKDCEEVEICLDDIVPKIGSESISETPTSNLDIVHLVSASELDKKEASPAIRCNNSEGCGSGISPIHCSLRQQCMSMKELMECKHPTAWNEFEKGLIDEDELARKFFKDGRNFDLEGLKTCMKNGYSYLDGVESLLAHLKHNNYEMHAFTDYPIWYQMIEEKLKLSDYLSWTFCSCTVGKQKPDPGFYTEVIRFLGVEPGSCIFVDDRRKNIEGAVNAGMTGIQFKDADVLRQELSSLGVNVASKELSSS